MDGRGRPCREHRVEQNGVALLPRSGEPQGFVHGCTYVAGGRDAESDCSEPTLVKVLQIAL